MFPSFPADRPAAIRALLKPTGQILCLIKPQFEAGREKVGKKGVVRDPAVHEEVLQNFLALAAELELTVRNLTFSPVRGPEGNIEFLGHLSMERRAASRRMFLRSLHRRTQNSGDKL